MRSATKFSCRIDDSDLAAASEVGDALSWCFEELGKKLGRGVVEIAFSRERKERVLAFLVRTHLTLLQHTTTTSSLSIKKTTIVSLFMLNTTVAPNLSIMYLLGHAHRPTIPSRQLVLPLTVPITGHNTTPRAPDSLTRTEF